MKQILIKLILTFTLLTYTVSVTFCQGWKLNQLGIPMIKPEPDKMLEKYELLNSIDTTGLGPKWLWSYFLAKSSYHHYMEKDSVVEFFHMATSYSSRAVCRMMSFSESYVEGKNKEGNPNAKWILDEIEGIDVAAFKKSCYEKHDLFSDKPKDLTNVSKIVSHDTSAFEKRIMSNDQKYRSLDPVPWDLQTPLDKINRSIIDSLYNAHVNFLEFTAYDMNAVSYVIHHSEDLAWTKIWIERMLDLYSKNPEFKLGKVFGPAINRFYNPIDGLDEDKEIFIKKLKAKYTKELCEAFLFYDWYQ